MSHNKWAALQLAREDAAQVDILLRAIYEADAVVVGIGAGMSAADGFTYMVNVLHKTFQILSKNMVSLICYKPVYIPLIVGRNTGHSKVVLLF